MAHTAEYFVCGDGRHNKNHAKPNLSRCKNSVIAKTRNAKPTDGGGMLR